MALYISSLNSGSNGNCYYIGTDKEAVLVDAGISCRETETRMKRLGLPLENLKAIFISHEHSDHIKGLSTLSLRYNIPVYITDDTRKQARIKLDLKNTFSFTHLQKIQLGHFEITPFSKHHDATDPFSFTINYNGINVGVFTDIGLPCKHLVSQFKLCHAAFLEANYDNDMLDNGNYPIYLKNRISGDKGHLSNTQALELFIKHRPAHMSHLLLSHLSKNNNSPELVQQLFDKHAGAVKIIVASRYQESELFSIGKGTEKRSTISKQKVNASQLKFSF
jgi:phosphoribosyl 1,2-cyclic phosphodiesterase